MRIVTLGSKVVDDAIRNIHPQNIVNVGRKTNISPFVVSYNYGNGYGVNYNLFRDNYIAEVVDFEFNGEKLLEMDFDKLVLDILDCRLEYEEIILEDGKTFRISNTNYIEKEKDAIIAGFCAGKKITSRKIHSPLKFKDEELQKEIVRYVDYLKKYVDISKCILMDIKLPTEYVSKNNTVEVFGNFMQRSAYNKFFEKCVRIFYAEMGCQIIESPEKLLADESIEMCSLFSFSMEYYRYLLNTISNPAKKQEDLNEYLTLLRRRLCTYSLMQLRNVLREKYFGYKILILGEKLIYTEEVKQLLGCAQLQIIDYTETSNMSYVENEMQEFENVEKIVFVIPEIFSEKVFSLFGGNGSKRRNYIYFEPTKRILNDFSGEYKDIYNNYVVSRGRNTIEIQGWANIIDIDNTSGIKIKVKSGNHLTLCKNVKSLSARELLRIDMRNGGKIKIESDCTFGNACKIDSRDFGQITIGKDCMFSSEIVLKCDKGFGERMHNSIVLGNHVWVGLRCFLHAGTHVAEGCIIGARSDVQIETSNNCVLIGCPAVVIKKNTCWNRSREKDAYLEIDEEYRKFTE